jgi:Rhodopirellula transposase DDE domain
LFSFISINWRGKPLRSYRTIVQLIAATTTDAGLKVITSGIFRTFRIDGFFIH